MIIPDNVVLFINLLCYIAIFFFTFYVAIHNRTIDRAVITELWYVGLASFALALSIVFQFLFGDAFPLSYTSIGSVAETMFSLTIAMTIGTVFLTTVKADLKNAKKRQKPKKSLSTKLK